MAGFQYGKQGQGAFESDSLLLGQSLLKGRKEDRIKKLLAIIAHAALQEGRKSLGESIDSKIDDATEWFKRTEADLRETYNTEHFPMLQDTRQYQLSPDTHNREEAERMFLLTPEGSRIEELGGLKILNPTARGIAEELIQERQNELNKPYQNFIDSGIFKSADTFRKFSEPAYQVLQKQYESIKDDPANRHLLFNLIDKIPLVNKFFTKTQLKLDDNLNKAETKYKEFQTTLAESRKIIPYQSFSEEKLRQLAGVAPTGSGITPKKLGVSTQTIYNYLISDDDQIKEYEINLHDFNNKLELPKYNQAEIDALEWDEEKYGPKPTVDDIKPVNKVGRSRKIFAPFDPGIWSFEIKREDVWEVKEITDKNTDDTYKFETNSNVDPLYVYSHDIAKIVLGLEEPFDKAIINSSGKQKDAAILRKPSQQQLFDMAMKIHAEHGYLSIDPTTDKLILIPLSQDRLQASLMSPDRQQLANNSAGIEEGLNKHALDGEEVLDSLLQTVEQELFRNAGNISTDELTKIERSKRDENGQVIDEATRDAAHLSLLINPPESLQGTSLKLGEQVFTAGGLSKQQIGNLYNKYVEAYGRNLELESLMDSARLPTRRELIDIGRGPRPTVGGVLAEEAVEKVPPAWTRQLDREARTRLQNYVDTGRKSQFLKDALERFNLPTDASPEVVNNFLTQSSKLVVN